MTQKVLIMGAAGKDFHVFNTCYRENPDARVVAFTATQIPHIDDRRYPRSLSGPIWLRPDAGPWWPPATWSSARREVRGRARVETRASRS